MTNPFEWMAWTMPVALFFSAVLLMLIGMTIWQLKSPSIERRGWLPIATTRGDRLFIGLLMAAYLNLIWAGVTDLHQAMGAVLSLVLALAVLRWG